MDEQSLVLQEWGHSEIHGDPGLLLPIVVNGQLSWNKHSTEGNSPSQSLDLFVNSDFLEINPNSVSFDLKSAYIPARCFSLS